MSRSRTQQLFATWLALLALGLLVFAPTVSRTVQALEHHPASGMQCAEHMPQGAHHMGDMGNMDHTGPHDVLDACAYCSLLHDSPALPWSVAVPPLVVPVAATVNDCEAPTSPYRWPLDLCPRGPPLS